MRCDLMHKDISVAEIEVGDRDGSIFRLGDVHRIDHMPVSTLREGKADVYNLGRWWESRSIPPSRSGLSRLLSGLGLRDAKSLLVRSYGLSLSDHYWIRPEGSGLRWDDVNFFTNSFPDDVGQALFGRDVVQGEMDLMSPDNTSEGNLIKRWGIVDGRRCLLKGGSRPNWQEPFNEVAASIIMDAAAIDHVAYDLVEHSGMPCSICDCFIDEHTEFVSMAHIEYGSHCWGPYEACVSSCSGIGVDIVPFLDTMLTLDYIIGNEDRHLHNFGLIRDPDTLEWLHPAPLFDCGASMGYNLKTPDILSDAGVNSRPFRPSHDDQIGLVTDLGWLDTEAVRAVLPDVGDVFKGHEAYVDLERREAIMAFLDERLQSLESIIGSRFGG